MAIEINPSLPPYYGASCDWYDVPCHASSVLTWVGDFFAWLPLKIYCELLEALLDALLSIPLPVSVDQLNAAASALSQGGYVAGLLNLDFGVTTVFGSLFFRTLIRHIPFIGR